MYYRADKHKAFSDLEVLAEMVTKAPTRVAIVEPCLGEPKDFEVGTMLCILKD